MVRCFFLFQIFVFENIFHISSDCWREWRGCWSWFTVSCFYLQHWYWASPTQTNYLLQWADTTRLQIICLISFQVNDISTRVNDLLTRVRSARTTTTANAAGAYSAIADYTISSGTLLTRDLRLWHVWSGTKCGPQTITGWTQKIDWWRNGVTVQVININHHQLSIIIIDIQTTSQFNTGTGLSTTPVNGYYHICAYSRYI